MQRYKLILGLKPDLSADKQKKVLAKIKEIISEAGGKMGEVKSKGLTKLAYPIAGFTEANFTNIFFEVPARGEARLGRPGDGPEAHQPLAGGIKPLQKELRMIKEALRIMVVREEVKG